MNKLSWVYRLRSVVQPDRVYTGLTDDLDARLTKHNEGGVPSTTPYKPWQIESVHGFRSREKAAVFDQETSA